MTSDTPLPPPARDPRPTPHDRDEQTIPAPGRRIEGQGEMIGPYKLLQRLGEGGMGQVWVADQEAPVKRRVALKVIKTGMDTEQVIARFEAERQALAMMDHTNIARVLDAGQTSSGRPYFVMELVKGVPITKYCDELHLTLRDRLKLFIPVCQAIQHAHQKGIIHRDIKPSNVLVCMQDGQPVPKVIDFGLAKALGQKLTQHTMVTEFGAVVGTLEYMSPEQAELSALDIDTRADVYALGVMLYELLVGTTPLTAQRLKQVAFDELLRCIREVDPPRPSTRLSESKETIVNVAALRKTEPLRLTRDLQGDLDWIVMKCLEKDRTRRYDAAAALARDVERFLTDEPIEARPPSLIYQTQKFVHKNRFGIAVAASFLFLLLAATVVSSWQAYRATRAEELAKINEQKAVESEKQAIQQQQLAEANEKRAKENERLAKESALAADKSKDAETASLKKQIEFAQSELSSRKQSYALVEVLETIFNEDNLELEATDILPRIKEKLEQIVETVDKAEGADPMLRGRLRQSLGSMLMAFNDYDRALQEMQKAVEVHRSLSGPESHETLSARNRLGLALLSADRKEEAKQILDDVYAIRMRVLGPDHDDTIVSLHNLAWFAQKTGDTPSALAKYREIVDRERKLHGEDSAEMVETIEALAICYREGGQILKAVEQGEIAVRQRTKLNGPEDWKTLHAKYNLAWAHGLAGNADEAIEIYEGLVESRKKIGGALHQRTLEAMSDLAWAYGIKRDYPKAIAKYEDVLAKRRELLGYDDPKTLATQGYLAQTYDSAAMYDKSLPLYADLVERMQLKLGKDAIETWDAENNYAFTCDHAGKHDLAGQLYEGVLAAKRKKLGPDDPPITVAINNLGNHFYNTSQYEKALPLYQEALDRDEKHWGADHHETLVVLVNLGMTFSRLHRHEEAIESLSGALKRRISISGPDHESTFACMIALADAYQAKGDLKSSLTLNEQLAREWQAKFGADHKDTLARWRTVRWQRSSIGDKSGALEVALKLHEQTAKTLGEHDPMTMQDQVYVADLYEAVGKPEVAEPMRRANLEFVQTQPTGMFMTPIAKTSLGRNLIQQKQFADARPLLEEVIDYYRKSLPGNISQYSISLLLAKCYVEESKFDVGEKLLFEAIEGLKKYNSTETPEAMGELAELYKRWKKPDEAEKWRAQAEQAKKQVAAPSTPNK